MESESIRLLRERGAELEARLSEVRAQLRLLEDELRQVTAGLLAMESTIRPTGYEASRKSLVHHAKAAHPDVLKMTIKQLVTKALSERFDDGATSNQLLDYFAISLGRDDVIRTSLSPQLSRLKEEGRIRLDGRVWRIGPPDNEFHTTGEMMFPSDDNGDQPDD